jgi:hypothetical protein
MGRLADGISNILLGKFRSKAGIPSLSCRSALFWSDHWVAQQRNDVQLTVRLPIYSRFQCFFLVFKYKIFRNLPDTACIQRRTLVFCLPDRQARHCLAASATDGLYQGIQNLGRALPGVPGFGEEHEGKWIRRAGVGAARAAMGLILVQFLTGLASAASLFLIAAGLSIIFGVTRIVNFAHGSFYMLGAYIAYSLIGRVGGGAIGFWSSVLLAAIAVGVIGVAVEMLLLRRIYQAPELFQLLATFGVVLVVQDATLWLWGPEDLLGPRAPGLSGAVKIAGHYLPEYDLAMIAIAPGVLAGLWLLFHRTRWGVLLRAATQDRELVGTLGVNQAW